MKKSAFIFIFLFGILLGLIFQNCGARFELHKGPSSSLGNPPPEDPPVQFVASKEPRMGGRWFVSNKLQHIFGVYSDDPDGRQIWEDKNYLILFQDSFFGEPCDHNGWFTACGYNRFENLNLSHVGKNSVPRQAFLSQFCHIAATCNTCINHASDRAFGNGQRPAPSKETIDQAYELFYPGIPPSELVNEALLDIANKAKVISSDPIEPWRWVFLSLCQTPEWQIP